MMASDATGAANLHGTAISIGGRAVLLRGPSGSGKSDLALRSMALRPGPLVTHQPMLVADDRVLARLVAGRIEVSCPTVLKGMIEVRGIGIVRVPFVEVAALALVADLVEPAAIARLPDPCSPAVICGQSVTRVLVAPFEASTPLKLLLALENIQA